MQKWPLLEPRCLERSSHDGFLSERSLGKLKSRTRLVRREGDFRYSGCAAVRHRRRYVHLLCNNTLCLTATPRRMATPPARRTRLYLYCAREPFLEKYWSGQNRTSRTACAGPVYGTMRNLRYNHGAPLWTIFGGVGAVSTFEDRRSMCRPSRIDDRCADLRRSMVVVSTFEDRCRLIDVKLCCYTCTKH